MKLNPQRRLAASVFGCSKKRVRFDQEALESISEAITKQDIRELIDQGVIQKLPKTGQSRVRANKRLVQRRKGRQSGPGSYKGKRTARLPRKKEWMDKIRAQRSHLKSLRENGEISSQTFRALYNKARGGFFRSKRHISLYIQEQNLAEDKQ